MRKSVIVLLILCLGAFMLTIAANWTALQDSLSSTFKNQADATTDLQKAQQLMQEGDFKSVLGLIQIHENSLEYQSEQGKQWVDMLIEISSTTRNAPQLIALYDNFPQAFDENEERSLRIADAYLASFRPKDYAKVRSLWKGRETIPQDWLILDADVLILNNQKREARRLLNSQSFDGPEDTGRLVRLALLSVPGDSKAAWDHLTEAYKKDPTNPDIHTYRGRLLESEGKNSLALSEYISAVQTAPTNIFLKDQLADFYLRNNEYEQAMSIWIDALKSASYDPIWMKAFFWNRIITPIQYDWSVIAPPKGDLHPLVRYLLTLPDGTFWNENNFANIPNGQRFLTTQQATFWLRLLQDLKTGKEKEAYELLQFNPFRKASWNPELETALKHILSYRKNGRLNPNDMHNPLDQTREGFNSPSSEKTSSGSNPFFTQINELAQKASKENGSVEVSNDLRALILSDEAFSATFLSTGWLEAALALHKAEVYPDNFPDWIGIAMTQAMRVNRSDEESLTFAGLQKQSEGLSLLIGELLAVTKQTQSAIEKLQKLTKEPSDIGMRAAWLISLIYIERGDYQLAEEAINSQPRLANSVTGKETAARIALLMGNEELAKLRYSAIKTDSSEAKSYLARTAFAAKDWAKARELTEQLLQQYPDNLLLQENLKKIIEKESKANPQ